MARIGDLEGNLREGTYLDPEGVRGLIRQLHAIVLLLDTMTGEDGDTSKTAAAYGKDARVTGVGYLVDRNNSTLKEMRRAVKRLAAESGRLLDVAVRLVDDHTGVDGEGGHRMHNTGR